jgi:protein-disulfide isomerase
MNQILRAILVACALLFISSSTGQTPDSSDEKNLLALIKEVQAQQAQIADNEAKIDAKLAEVTETIRQARIYSKRER